MVTISQIAARQILDSRGIPTVEVQVVCDNGIITLAHASSNPDSQAIFNYETRDEDPNRFLGLGVDKAIRTIEENVAPVLIGQDVTQQAQIDQILLTLDPSGNFSQLGTNVSYPVSAAICKAGALANALPVFRWVSLLSQSQELRTPLPIVTLISGSRRGANNNIDFEEFLILPQSFPDYEAVLRVISEIYSQCRKLLIENKSIMGVGDDGGLSPNLFTNQDAFALIKEAVLRSNYVLKQQILLGLRIGAQSLFNNNQYILRDRTQPITSAVLLEYYQNLLDLYPLFYIEDPFANEDWTGWLDATQQLGSSCLVAASNIYASDKNQFQRLKDQGIANAVVIVPRLAGTVTNLISLAKDGKDSGRRTVLTAEVGETDDAFIADLAVGAGVDFVKFGAPSRGERTVKYNRLNQIHLELTQG